MGNFYYIGLFVLFLVVWIVIVYLAFLAWQYRRYRFWLKKQKYVCILIKVPKGNEKTALSAEQMYSSMHGILRSKWGRMIEGSLQEHVSFEIVSSNKFIKFYAYIPEILVEFVEGQIYAQYPTVLIEKVDDYIFDYKHQNKNFSSCELVLEKDEVYPLRTFETFDVDPLAGITAVLSKLGDANNQIWLQVLVRPIENDWQKKSQKEIAKIRSGVRGVNFLGLIGGFIELLLTHLSNSGSSEKDSSAKKILSGPEEEAIAAINMKAVKLGFEVKIRIVAFGNNPQEAKSKLQSIVGTFKQFSLTNLNSFSANKISVNNLKDLELYKNRSFLGRGFVLNTAELASLFHLPSISVETPTIVWSHNKVAEPPSNLPTIDNSNPDDLTVFAKTNFRELENVFGIKTEDRSKHVYIVGKTGMGKTSLLQNMVIDDMKKGRGVAVVDPHGDFVDMVLNYVPTERLNDVVLFDPGDRENPIAFNLLENVAEDYKPIIASGLIAIFKKLWHDSWGPRLEHILRYTFLALLDFPGSTFLSVPRMLSDEVFRGEVIEKIKDPVVKDFWEVEFNGYTDKLRQDAISPIQNKIGQFLASSTIRNIVGQPNTAINIRQVMDSKKILLVKVAKGVVGEDNAALLGAMIITKIQLAAMSRADILEIDRVPFNLYVDEFQNFATESFASILSEARKYKLNLHVANQYIEQMEDVVRGAVFGNVGTLVTFRVGATDADYLAKEFAPTFTGEDLTNLEKYHIYLRMTIDGISSPAFSATTLSLPSEKTDNLEKILALSREKYGTKRDFVEGKIKEWSENLDAKKQKSGSKNTKKSDNRRRRGVEKKEITVEQEIDPEKKEQLLSKLKIFQKDRVNKIDANMDKIDPETVKQKLIQFRKTRDKKDVNEKEKVLGEDDEEIIID